MESYSKSNFERKKYAKCCIFIFVVYVILVLLFPVLAGESMTIRDSKGNRELITCEDAIIEIANGQVVEQTIKADIMRIKSVSVQFGAYYRTNQGTICIQLVRETDGQILAEQLFDASQVSEGSILTVYMEDALEGCFGIPLVIRVFSDSVEGSAVTPLRGYVQEEGEFLAVNGEVVEGTLCFNILGEDYIWLGINYWKVAVGFGLLLFLMLAYDFGLFCKNRRSYFIDFYYAISKYRYLIKQLVLRDFKVRYKRSALGFFWSFLNPLFMLIVQYIVFSNIFRADIENYPSYLILGIICYNFFSEAVSMALTSVVGNVSLITKVYMPKYIYPLTRVLSSCVNLLISLVPLVIVCLATGVHFQKAAVLSLFFLCCHIIFSLGLGILLSAAMVFFRDIQFLWGIVSMMWMYATPIFYPASILPDKVQTLLKFNPLYHFIQNIRICILDGVSPEPIAYVQSIFIALGMLLLGAFVFKKVQNKFLLYL